MLRELKSPEKLFEQFASVKNEKGELFMTPHDFLHVVTPSKKIGNTSIESSPKFQRIIELIDFNKDKLISYDEFIFFTTLLSIPPKYFNISFKMFDEDGSGEIDAQEFKNAMRLIQQSATLTRTENKDKLIGNVSYPVFFGKDGKKLLQFKDFESYVNQLREAVLQVQFEILSNGESSISATDYANHLLSYSPSKSKQQKIDQLRNSSEAPKISYDDFKSFVLTLEYFEEIEFALRSYVSIGEPFTEKQLIHTAKAVANINLSFDLVQLLFFVYDKNGDGKLDSREFVSVLKAKQKFGFAKNENFLSKLKNCTAVCTSNREMTKY